MKKLLTLIVACVAFYTTSYGQDMPVLKFDNTHHDFGVIKEEAGPVTHIYKFKNNGKAPLKLTNVQPACGCTASEWTKEEVAPGKEGFVKATYDVANRPGKFNKSITIHSNTTPAITLLTFSGEVTPRTKTIEDSFPQVSGNFRYESNYLNFGYLTNDKKDTSTLLSLVNTGNAPITIKEVKGDAPYVTGKNLPITVKPKQRVQIPIHYNASQVGDYGMTFTRFKLITDDNVQPEKPIDVIADIHQFVPKMTDAEKEKAAKIVFAETAHDFGSIKQGEMVKNEFKFTNKGKQDLVIYKVKTTCGCTASEPEKSKLKPGETSNIKVTFDSAGKHGKDEKQITVYTNDPVNPEITLKIVSNVVTPESGASGNK